MMKSAQYSPGHAWVNWPGMASVLRSMTGLLTATLSGLLFVAGMAHAQDVAAQDGSAQQGVAQEQAQEIESPAVLLERASSEVLQILRDDREKFEKDPDQILKLVDDYILPHLDDVTMAKLALGKSWKQATTEQKREFVNEFRNLLVRTYSKSLIEFSDQSIEYPKQTFPEGAKKALVHARVVQPGGPSIPLAYRVRVKDATWKVYDIQVDGVSLVTSYRGTFTQEVRKSGIDGLLEYLRDKNRDLSEKQAASAS